MEGATLAGTAPLLSRLTSAARLPPSPLSSRLDFLLDLPSAELVSCSRPFLALTLEEQASLRLGQRLTSSLEAEPGAGPRQMLGTTQLILLGHQALSKLVTTL